MAAGAPDGFGSRWQTVRGLRLHALASADGLGDAVVFLPGLVTAGRSMVPLARALVRRCLRVWIVDPPGFGYSDKPRRVLSVSEQAAPVADWLAAIGCRPARMLGNSFGSQVAAAPAACHPGAAERVVLLSPTLAPARRRRLSWLRVLPVPGPACVKREPWHLLHATGLGLSPRLLAALRVVALPDNQHRARAALRLPAWLRRLSE